MTTPRTDKSAKTWVLLLTSAASFMAILDAMVVTTALGAIRQDLGASIELLEWTVNAYNLSFAVLLLTGAALGDRFGRRRVFLTGIALFVAASLGCAVAGDAGWLIAGRALQGAGAALLMPVAMALLSAAFPPEERGKALGIFGGLNGIALILGPIVGGAVAEGLAWHWIFWINLPIGLVLIPLARRRIPESHGPRAGIDMAGVVLVTGAALGIVWGLMRGNHLGWTDGEVLALLAAGLVLALGFVAHEQRAREPMVPMRFFRSRAFAAGIAASFLFYSGMYGVLFLLRNSCKRRRETDRSALGCAYSPGPRPCSCSRRSAAAWSTGWASARWSWRDCSCRRSAWRGSAGSPPRRFPSSIWRRRW